jgi:hypothetical protein
VELAKSYDVKPTLFVTHQSIEIEKRIHEEDYEFGLHPNFENLLAGKNDKGNNSIEVIENLKKLYKKTNLIRSHSLTSSGRLKKIFHDSGFEIESSVLFFNTNTVPLPWREPTGIIQVPIVWEDDVWFGSDNRSIKEPLIRNDCLNVFTFHPIHLYLNTSSIKEYDSSKIFINDENELKKRRSKDMGTRDYYCLLMDKIFPFKCRKNE